MLLTDPVDVTINDLSEILASLAHRGVSGVPRLRRLAAITDFCSSLRNQKALSALESMALLPKRASIGLHLTAPDVPGSINTSIVSFAHWLTLSLITTS